MTAYTIEKYKLNSNGQWVYDHSEYYLNKKTRNDIFIGYLKILVDKKIETIDFKKGLVDIDESGYYASHSDMFGLYFLIGALAFGLGIALSVI